jgi:hypothetical protein
MLKDFLKKVRNPDSEFESYLIRLSIIAPRLLIYTFIMLLIISILVFAIGGKFITTAILASLLYIILILLIALLIIIFITLHGLRIYVSIKLKKMNKQ